MSRPTKLTKDLLKKIIEEERQKIADQKDRVQKAKNSKDIRRFYEVRKELKALLQLNKQQKRPYLRQEKKMKLLKRKRLKRKRKQRKLQQWRQMAIVLVMEL